MLQYKIYYNICPPFNIGWQKQKFLVIIPMRCMAKSPLLMNRWENYFEWILKIQNEIHFVCLLLCVPSVFLSLSKETDINVTWSRKKKNSQFGLFLAQTKVWITSPGMWRIIMKYSWINCSKIHNSIIRRPIFHSMSSLTFFCFVLVSAGNVLRWRPMPVNIVVNYKTFIQHIHIKWTKITS